MLYAKQSFSGMAMCGYPDAYVDPYPELFSGLTAWARKGEQLAELLPDDDTTRDARTRLERYFEGVAATTTRLAGIAERARRDQPLLREDLEFINHAVSVDGRSIGCTHVEVPGGWYAGLHFDSDDALTHHPTIADVHTKPSDEVDPRALVLEVATGQPQGLAVQLPTCAGPRLFRGYVSSYYELVTEGLDRLDDSRWTQRLHDREHPPAAPSWLGDLAPPAAAR